MKLDLKKIKTFLIEFFSAPKYIGELPAGLAGFARSRFLIPLAALGIGVITLLITPFSWTFLGAVAAVFLLALLYAFYICYTLVKGDYYVLQGVIRAVEPAGLFGGAVESITRSGKNQKLIIEQPDGEFAAVYLGRKVRNDFSEGLPVIVYAENIFDENGVETVRGYYTIVIAPAAPEENTEVEVEVNLEEMGFPEAAAEVDEKA